MSAPFSALLRQLLLAFILLGASAASAQLDVDADGFGTPIDCDDGNPDIYPGAFEFCDGLDNDCDGQVDEDCSVSVQARTFLEGPYNSGSGLMNDGMRALGLVPITEPCSGIGYSHAGGGGEVTTPAVLATSGNDAIVDWVVLELRAARMRPSFSLRAALYYSAMAMWWMWMAFRLSRSRSRLPLTMWSCGTATTWVP